MKRISSGGFILSRIHQVSARVFNRLLKEYNIIELNGAQGRILFILWQTDNIPISELAKKSMLSKSTLTSMLDKLEEKGFIKRIFNKMDRRKIFIQRTFKDKEFRKIFELVSEKMTSIWYSDFSDSEINQFEGYLDRILQNTIKAE